MSKARVITKKPSSWKENVELSLEAVEFSGKVHFPETIQEAYDMGYSEEFIMNTFEANQTIRVQSVINSLVGKREDHVDGHVPTPDEVQAGLDAYDFTSIKSRSLPLSEKVTRLADGASKASIEEMITALQAEADAMVEA
jgi:hypothetical protein